MKLNTILKDLCPPLIIFIFPFLWYYFDIYKIDSPYPLCISLLISFILWTFIGEIVDYIILKSNNKSPVEFIFNDFLISLRNVIILSMSPILLYYLGKIKFDFNIPNFIHLIVFTILWMFITEAMAYIIHRGIHHPKLYKIHKMHHKYVLTRPMYAQYLSIFELFLHIIPVSTFPFIILSPVNIFVVIYLSHLLVFYNTISHMKYKNNDDRHALHHISFNKNYGNISLFDRLMGTEYEIKRK